MPDKRYEASRQTIGALLSTTSPRIEVPEWQRSYSWEPREVETFWQDLISFSERYPEQTIEGEEYFLGSIVLVVGGPTNLLLDGQQRLATATILLSAIRDACRLHKADAATRIQDKYICDFDDTTDTVTPVLTLNLYDRDFFRKEVQDSPPTPQAPTEISHGSHDLIRKAREFFENQIAGKNTELGIGQSAFNWNQRILRVLCNHMSVVAVTSSDEDNAANVFETLNDRGIGLSTPDLLRNLLIRRARTPERQDLVVDAWDNVLAIHDEASVNEYLRHYWISHHGDVKARKLYREIKDTVVTEDRDSVELSMDMDETASVYRGIASANADNTVLALALEGMRALGAKILYPAMLSGYAALDGDQDTTELEILATALVSLFVRYNVIAGRDTTILESTVYEMALDLRNDQDFGKAISQLTALSPSEDEFLAQFEQVGVKRIPTARYLLRQIEHAKRTTEELIVGSADRVHVEHIYPKSPDGVRWSDHEAAVNRLGNMTLLSKRLNTSIKNADFDSKKDRAYTMSEIIMTRELEEYDVWNIDSIESRQQELARYARDIWRMPEEEVP